MFIDSKKFDEKVCMDFEYEFRKKFPKLRVALEHFSGLSSCEIVIFEYEHVDDQPFTLVARYEGTDFDLTYIDDERAKVNRLKEVTGYDIRKFYLNFLKKTFPKYKQAYLEHKNKEAEEDMSDDTDEKGYTF